MAKPKGDRDSGHWMEGVCGILALLLSYLLSCLQGGQTSSLRPALRERGVPSYPLDGNNEPWKDIGDALAMPSASGDLRFFPNIDPEGQYNVRLVDQLEGIGDLIENIDVDAAAAEAALDMLLAVAEVASLPRQIERDEANNMMVRRPRVSSSVAESGVAPSSLVYDVAIAAGAPQHLPPQAPVPEIVAADAPAPDADAGILAGVLPQQIEDEAHAEAQVEVEVVFETSPADAPAPDVDVGILADVLPQQIENEAHAEAQVEVEVVFETSPAGMLEQILDVARRPQFATPSMAVPSGELESNLEERVLVDHAEAGDSSADLQAKINIEDDVENLEIEEPHAKGLQ